MRESRKFVRSIKNLLAVFALILSISTVQAQEAKSYISLVGEVVDSSSGKKLSSASISIENSNLGTVANVEGRFTLKVPLSYNSGKLLISYVGYKNVYLDIESFGTKRRTVKLHRESVMLGEVLVQDADKIISNVVKNIGINYPRDRSDIKGFFRETVSKGRRDVALSEAVLAIRKESYGVSKRDNMWLLKGRKQVGTDKRDTLLFKLQGGPINALYLDLAKYRYNLLDADVLERYQFSFDGVDKINGSLNYIIGFSQKGGGDETLLVGKLYIDIDSYAISKANFSINLENRSKAASIFIKKKPRGAKVYPTEADYSVTYKEVDGVWYYNHSRSDITFKIDWDKRLFHSHYHATTEMAITDIYSSDDSSILELENSDRLKSNIILNETIDGFGDINFWGSDNTIEPEKSIESAIKKIRRNLKKDRK